MFWNCQNLDFESVLIKNLNKDYVDTEQDFMLSQDLGFEFVKTWVLNFFETLSLKLSRIILKQDLLF